MKMILKIARAELRTLFYSPVAWFILLVFYLLVAITFFMSLRGYTTAQEVFLESDPNWFGFDKGMGQTLFLEVARFIMKYSYMFIPLITMGVINKELTTGSIKLLYSSPVRIREIVLGKYLGLIVFNTLLVGVLVVVLFSGLFTINEAEYKWYLSMAVGFFLLFNAYTAIGLFISCLTNYQIVAAVLTFAVFFVFNNISAIGQQYDFIRDLTFFLSISGKAEMMIGGMMTSRDILYFLLIILLFLIFTLIKIKSTLEFSTKTTLFARYTGAFLCIILLGYFSSRPGKVAYLDLTENKINTIHPSLQQIIKGLDGSKLTVTLYTNLLCQDPHLGMPRMRNNYVWGMWEQYKRFYPNIELRYEYLYHIEKGDSTYYRMYPGKSMEEIVALEAKVLGAPARIFKPSDLVQSSTSLEGELGRKYAPLMLLEYKGESVLLRSFPGEWPTQSNVAASLLELTRNELPHLAFLTGHFERSLNKFTERDCSYLINKNSSLALVNNGIIADTLSVLEQDVPENVAALVLADPKSELLPVEKKRIDAYLENGGNAIILADPGKQHILRPITESIGVYLDSGIIVRQNAQDLPHKIMHIPFTREGNTLSDEVFMENYRKYNLNGALANLFGAINLSYKELDGFNIEPIITMKGSTATWIENGKLVVDSAAPVYSLSEGDVRMDEYILGVKLTREIHNKEQRILVLADGDMIGQRRKHFSYGNAFFSWVLNNEFPIYANYPPAPDRFVNISSQTAGSLVKIFVYLIPAILLTAAIIILLRRKRK